MNKFLAVWPIIRNIAAALACACFYLSASTSDYYTMELGVTEPASVWVLSIIGAILALPAIVNFAKENLF